MGRSELGEAVEREVDLDERRPVIATAQPRHEIGGQLLGTDQIDQCVVGREVGNDHRSADLRSVTQTHAGDVTVLDENLLHRGAVPDLAPIRDKESVQVLAQRADANVASLPRGPASSVAVPAAADAGAVVVLNTLPVIT